MKRLCALGKRALFAFCLMLGASFVIYFTVRAAPGDAIDAISPMGTLPEVKAKLAAEFGLDQGVLPGYATWALRSLQGDFGESLVFAPGDRVMALALPAFARTLCLSGGALLACLLLALGLSALASSSRSALKSFGQGALYVCTSAPSFVLAVCVAQALNAIIFRFVDQAGYVTPVWYPIPIYSQSVMPYFFAAFALVFSDGLLIETRNSVSSELTALRQAPFIAAIRAKGANPTPHLVRNLIVPLCTTFTSRLPLVLGGAVIVEYIFTLDGAGYVLLEASKSRDVPVVVGLSVLFTAIVVLVNLLGDFIRALFDPREVARGG